MLAESVEAQRLPAGYETLQACILCGSSRVTPLDRELRLNRCRDCGLVFDNPRPTIARIAQFYSSQGKYDHWLPETAAIDRINLTVLRRLRLFRSDGALLDIGAGIGMFLSHARRHYRCVGTEISSEGVARARAVYGLDLRHGSLESIDFGDQRFDVITMTQVLEHVPHPGATLDRCVSLLKPGGVLYLAMPNDAPWSLRVLLPMVLGRAGFAAYRAFARRGLRKLSLDGLVEVHVSHFSEGTLKRALRCRGLEVMAGGIDFHDVFMYRRGFIQIPRHLLYWLALALKALTGVNAYNCFWLMARRSASRRSTS